MNRRAMLALIPILALTFAGAPLARADMAPPPIVLEIEGQSATIATASPREATFHLVNRSDEAMDVFLFRAVVADGGSRIPLAIASASADGRPLEGRTVRVPARGAIDVTIGFELPAHLATRSSWEIDLRVTHGGFGGHDSRSAVLRRGSSRAKLATIYGK